MLADESVSFLFTAKKYAIVWLKHILFIHPAVEGYLRCFHLLAVINNMAVNIHEQDFVWTYAFTSLGQIPRSGHAQVVTLCAMF